MLHRLIPLFALLMIGCTSNQSASINRVTRIAVSAYIYESDDPKATAQRVADRAAKIKQAVDQDLIVEFSLQDLVERLIIAEANGNKAIVLAYLGAEIADEIAAQAGIDTTVKIEVLPPEQLAKVKSLLSSAADSAAKSGERLSRLLE